MRQIFIEEDESIEVFVQRKGKSYPLLRVMINGRCVTIMAPHALQRLQEIDLASDFRKSYKVVDRD